MGQRTMHLLKKFCHNTFVQLLNFHRQPLNTNRKSLTPFHFNTRQCVCIYSPMNTSARDRDARQCMFIPIHRIPWFNGPYPEYAMTRSFCRLVRNQDFRIQPLTVDSLGRSLHMQRKKKIRGNPSSNGEDSLRYLQDVIYSVVNEQARAQVSRVAFLPRFHPLFFSVSLVRSTMKFQRREYVDDEKR